ncbi:MAG TPA: hypothetical protein VGZ22_20365 [Isosphaeraceae bacterium]|nr:hypothetical protein [Isosphaeraceae bacterium]
MKRFLGAALATVFLAGLCSSVRADDQAAKAILDKGIKALGGEEKLSKADAITWKAKGKITFNDNANEFNSQTTVQGLDHYRGEFEGDFNGNKFMGVTVLNGDKGWRKFGDNNMEMDAEAVANEKRNIYLQLAPTTLVRLKGKGFQIETAGEETVGGSPAVGLKVTAPDGKDFTIYFDKESGLPVKQVAKVTGFMGEEFKQENFFSNYKDFNGIKKATKLEIKRDGEKFIDEEITDFKVLDKVDPDTFSAPK